jgi:hypothetical protein
MFENARLNRLIRDWYQRSQGIAVREPDAFDRFTYLWVSFDAWSKIASRGISGRGVINFCKTEKSLVAEHQRLLATDAEFAHNVARLKEMCPIRKITRRKKQLVGEEVRINNVAEFGEVLEAIYTIRNNFFHGDKSPNNVRDLELVELAFQILSRVFAEAVRLVPSD